MDFVQLALEHGGYVTLALVSFLSAVFPLVNAELAVAGLAAGMPGANILLLATVATGAQMAGKSTMYWLGRRGSAVTRGRFAGAIERWGHRFRGSAGRVGVLVFLSSASGLPPFYLISALAGLFKTSFLTFVLVGSAGRFLRFAVVGLSPAALKALF